MYATSCTWCSQTFITGKCLWNGRALINPFLACIVKCIFFLFFFYSFGRWGWFRVGVRALNLTVPVGSGQTISGTGRVRASVLSPCRPLIPSKMDKTILRGTSFASSNFLYSSYSRIISAYNIQIGLGTETRYQHGTGTYVTGMNGIRTQILVPCLSDRLKYLSFVSLRNGLEKASSPAPHVKNNSPTEKCTWTRFRKL